MDGLRIDAVHAMERDSSPDVLEQLSEAVHHGPGLSRHVHLILENDANEARYLSRDAEGRARHYTAQWNDDIHHCLHVLLTGEHHGYYEDYADRPVEQLGRCLTEGFAYQGEPSPHRGGHPRGEPSAHLPPTAFVAFLQNHDQIGNRAFGERIDALAAPRAIEAALALLLLSPQPPLLFMGEEWGATTPFLFFADFGSNLADAVREGRRREFARFPEFSDPAHRARIPDPLDKETFQQSILNWEEREHAGHAARLEFVRRLLKVRAMEIAPRLAGIDGMHGPRSHAIHDTAVEAHWALADGSHLSVLANLGAKPRGGLVRPLGRTLLQSAPDCWLDGDTLAAWSTVWFVQTDRTR